MSISTKDCEAEAAGFITIDWLREAKNEIDSLLGEGYAKKNPELLGMFIHAASIKYLASALNTNDVLSRIAISLNDLVDSIDLSSLERTH